MVHFEHLTAAIGGHEAVIHNNEGKADSNLKEMREEMLPKWKPTKKG
jgi:hypothetical protein